MAKTEQYKVKWDYVSSLGGPWAAGDLVELDEEMAEAVNRDSPGVLLRHVPMPARTRQVTKAPVTRGKKRGTR